MQSITLMAAAVAIYSHSVVAQGSDPTQYQDPNGNVDLSIGRDAPTSVYTGDQTPWSILDTLNQHCDGLTCNADPWKIPAYYVNGLGDPAGNSANGINDGEITVTALDAFISKDDDQAILIEALKSLASQPQAHQVETHYYCAGDETVPVAPGRLVRRDGMFGQRDVTCDQPDGTEIDQYSTAATFYVAVRDEGGAIRSELRIRLEGGTKSDELDKELCTDLLAAGSAVAGVFTGGAAAAAGLSLGSLICGAL